MQPYCFAREIIGNRIPTQTFPGIPKDSMCCPPSRPLLELITLALIYFLFGEVAYFRPLLSLTSFSEIPESKPVRPEWNSPAYSFLNPVCASVSQSLVFTRLNPYFPGNQDSRFFDIRCFNERGLLAECVGCVSFINAELLTAFACFITNSSYFAFRLRYSDGMRTRCVDVMWCDRSDSFSLLSCTPDLYSSLFCICFYTWMRHAPLWMLWFPFLLSLSRVLRKQVSNDRVSRHILVYNAEDQKESSVNHAVWLIAGQKLGTDINHEFQVELEIRSRWMWRQSSMKIQLRERYGRWVDVTSRGDYLAGVSSLMTRACSISLTMTEGARVRISCFCPQGVNVSRFGLFSAPVSVTWESWIHRSPIRLRPCGRSSGHRGNKGPPPPPIHLHQPWPRGLVKLLPSCLILNIWFCVCVCNIM